MITANVLWTLLDRPWERAPLIQVSIGGELAARGVHESLRPTVGVEPGVSCLPSPPRAPCRRGRPCRRRRPRMSGRLRLAGRPRRVVQLQRRRLLSVTSLPSFQRPAWHLQRRRGHPRAGHLKSCRSPELAGRCSLSGLWRSCSWGLERCGCARFPAAATGRVLPGELEDHTAAEHPGGRRSGCAEPTAGPGNAPTVASGSRSGRCTRSRARFRLR